MASPSHVDAAERAYERVHDLRNADSDYPPLVRAIEHERKAVAAMTPDEYYAYAVRVSRRFSVPMEAFDQAVLARATRAGIRHAFSRKNKSPRSDNGWD
jgi:hypothetical protein